MRIILLVIVIFALLLVAVTSCRNKHQEEPAAAGRNSDTRSDPNHRSTWSVLAGEREGRPVLLSVDSAYKRFSGKSEYAISLVVSIPYASPANTGLPTAEDNLNIQKLEDKIDAALRRVGKCHLVARLTWNETRHLFYYVHDSGPASAALEKLRSDRHCREFHFTRDADPEWKNVEQFLDACKEANGAK